MAKFTVESTLTEVDARENKELYRNTWPLRRAHYAQNKARVDPPLITYNEYINTVQNSDLLPQHLTLIDGLELHSSLIRQTGKFVDFERLATALTHTLRPIRYYSAIKPHTPALPFLLKLKKLKDYEVNLKQLRTRIVNDTTELLSGDVSVKMCLDIMLELIDRGNLQHVLLISRDPDFVDVMQKLAPMGVKFALVYNPDMPTSRDLLAEASYRIPIVPMFNDLNVYRE